MIGLYKKFATWFTSVEFLQALKKVVIKKILTKTYSFIEYDIIALENRQIVICQ